MADPVIPLCSVNCRVYGQDGLAQVGARVTAQLNSYEVYNGYVVPQRAEGVTDADGLCVLGLFPNELGSVESNYTVKITGTNGKTLTVTAVVPHVSEADLENCAVLPPFPGKVDGQLALEAVLEVGNIAQQAAQDALNALTDAQSAAQNATTASNAASASETNAGNSASAASVSAGNAAASATAAAGSATSAAGSATAAADSADDAADLVATINPSTIVRTSGDQSISGVKTFTSAVSADGGVNVPAGQTGSKARRADETVNLMDGAARMPTWTTAGRPASPSAGDTGFNTTLGCNETWNGTHWVADGIVESTPAATTSGTSHEITGIPPWIKRATAHLYGVSTTGTQYVLGQIGSGSLLTTGYLGTTIDTSGGVETTSTNGIPMRLASTANGLTGTIEIVREPGTFNYKLTANLRRNDSVGGGLIAHATVTLSGLMDRFALVRQGSDTFDAGKFWLTWEN